MKKILFIKGMSQRSERNKRYSTAKYVIKAYADPNNTGDFRKMKTALWFNTSCNIELMSKMLRIACNHDYIVGSSVRIFVHETSTLVRVIPILHY